MKKQGGTIDDTELTEGMRARPKTAKGADAGIHTREGGKNRADTVLHQSTENGHGE